MMTQKSNEEIYKSLSEEERNVTVTSVELTDKAFKGKTDYSAIARLNGKVVFREGEYFSTLEGLQLFVFKNGKQITAYNWKIEDGTKNFRILYSTKTDKSGKIFFGLILRGDVPIIVGHTEDIEQETHYELLVHQSLVDLSRELKKDVHIISYGNTLYYHNGYYYTQLDAKQLIKLYREHVDYELNHESSLHGYKELYGCFMTDPQIECSEPEDEPIYAPLENGIFDLVEWKLYPHSPDQITFTYIKAKYAPEAKCPIFEGYLHQVTGGDPQLMERFWMAIGYLLIYPARGKFFIFMKGVGNSGKSVLGRFIRQLYPKESISSIRLKNLTNQFGMASLATSVINFDMDMPGQR